ncbi:hypothetical protein O181_043105 [Austropuccinia psidii MF-1]|uniref:Uncharacterized protein n=1 Tax=Austropuccinia psidii MF-1 TaxID=1389203 RepID=A0A9Q3DLW6_9BASI|nr:hypothetical protein [Austropuccinia psidii MF-1]
MSSKLTELTESSPSVPPSSVMCGSDNPSQLLSPWSMASSGNFDPSQTYDGYKAVEVLDLSFTQCLEKEAMLLSWTSGFQSKKVFMEQERWAFGKKLPVSEAPTPDGTSGYSNFGGMQIYSSSEVPISRINTEGLVKRIRQISNSSPDPDAEGSDELEGEEAEVVHNSSGHQSSTSPSHPPAKRFQSQIVPSTPRTFQPMISTIPTSLLPASPSSSTTRPALAPAVRPYPIPQPRGSPIVTSQHLQTGASSSRRREEHFPLMFTAPQVFQKRDCWPI